MSKINIVQMKFFFETHRQIGHIELYKVLIFNDLYMILCVLFAYVFQKKYPTCFLINYLFNGFILPIPMKALQ
jgi:hypothetical protein